MQCIPKDKLLEHRSDTLMAIRKEFNLDKPGRIEDAIRIIREWVEQQPHFKKKDFNNTYLEIVIYACKGSLERAKKQIDRMCTVRTLMPHMFEVRCPKIDYQYLSAVFKGVVLPKLTPDHHRVFILKVNDKINTIKDLTDHFVYFVMVIDYLKVHDFSRGYITILDFTDSNIMDYVAKLNLVTFRQFFTIMIPGYGLRIREINVYTPSKLVDVFVSLLKQVVPPKLGDRIRTHKTVENISKIIPVDILPEDYGGKERSLEILSNDLFEVLSSEENLNYLRDLKKAGTDESLRQDNEFNEEYAGMPGTFRVLSVD